MTAPTAWQPIETAPQDGTIVLLHDAWCRHLTNAYYVGCYYKDSGFGPRWFSQGYPKKPTHWRQFERYEGPR